MRWVFRLVGALGVLAVLALGALALIPSEQVARLATDRFEAVTGRALTIEGAVSAGEGVPGRSRSYDVAANYKVLLENYSENYHTPFVHPEIDTTATEDYPMVSDGPVLYAWDRPLRPVDEAQRIMHDLLPGEPGWEDVAETCVAWISASWSAGATAMKKRVS